MSDNEKSTQTEEPNFRYNAALAQDIENKWQKIWDCLLYTSPSPRD